MSGRYDAGRDAFGEGKIRWSGDTIMAQLVSAEFAFNPSHRDPAEIKGRVGSAVGLRDKSIERGWTKAGSITFPQVKGPKVTGIVLWHAGEPDSTLLAHLDEISGFPIHPNGGDIHIDAPMNELFRI